MLETGTQPVSPIVRMGLQGKKSTTMMKMLVWSSKNKVAEERLEISEEKAEVATDSHESISMELSRVREDSGNSYLTQSDQD